MASSGAEKIFDEYECTYEEFQEWLLSEYIGDPDYEVYKVALECIVYEEKNRFEYDRTGKIGDMFIDNDDEEFYCRFAIKNQFEEWVNGYIECKKENK